MEFKGTKKEGANWVININNPAQVLIENVCIIDEPWHLEAVKADALLISNAPEMLDFINRISGEMLMNNFVLDERWYDQARELIKSATEI